MHYLTCSVDMLIIICSTVIQLNFITLSFASCILCSVREILFRLYVSTHLQSPDEQSHICVRLLTYKWALNKTFKCVCV